ncbi:M20 family metallopeptidase [Poseidonibacter antarcticus]|uniref:M20 family metallopeptidase n=1 Tax=Poseidonibacter antarcticus TaxID=2478538 RepID=UPI000EF4A149|nr:M20 family metallopeptidase [Poseidonibacter antarcticus]
MNYLNDLKKIININSFTKNKEGVDKVGHIMSQWLKDISFEETIYKRKEIGNHQLFTSRRKNHLKNILLLGHNDTVFPPNTFEGFTEDETWVYGPGVCDMKGGNIVALESLRNIYKENKEISNIDFLLVSDEESGSDDSKFVTLDIAKNYDYCFVFEAAGKNLEVVTGRKGVGTYTINIEGIPAHAGTSYTKGVDANLEASYKLQKLSALTNLELGTTVNVGKIEGGIGANTISPKCEMIVEIRYTTNKERDRLLSSLNEIVKTSYVKGTKSKLDGLIQRDVMEANENQNILITQLEKITNTKIPTEKRGGVSDANHVSSCGVTTLDGFGPFGDGDHTKKERALKETFEKRIKMMTSILNFFQKQN